MAALNDTTPKDIKLQTPLFILIILLLSGCAGQVNILPTLSNETIVDPQQGIVIARVISASNSSLPYNQLTIIPENFNESKNIKLERLISPPSEINGTTVFASPVKPGRYSLSSIRAFHSNGNFWYSDFVSSDNKLGTFTVNAGRVTDLGTLIYYPKSQEDKYLKTLIRKPDSGVGEVLEKHFPFYPFNSDNILTWDEDGNDNERFETYVFAAQNPVAFTESYKAPDGSVYFLGKLGYIVKRLPDGTWGQDAVETDLNLETIAVSENNHIVVGGAEGSIFLKKDQSDWQTISLTHDDQIEHLSFKGQTFIDAVVRQREKAIIYRLDMSSDVKTWKEIESYSSIDGWKKLPKTKQTTTTKAPKPKRISNISIWKLDGKNYITLYEHSIFMDAIFADSSPSTFRYDPSTWSIYDLQDDEFELSSVINAGAIKLGIKRAGFWSWDGRPDYFRYESKSDDWEPVNTVVYTCPDGAIHPTKNCSGPEEKKEATTNSRANKARRKTFQFATVPLFKNDLEGIAIVSFSEGNYRNSSVERKILETSDGGLHWSDTGSVPPKEYCLELIPEINDRLLVSCNGSSGDFYESTDKGATWKRVRQHGNF